jgi:5'-nucleotidase
MDRQILITNDDGIQSPGITALEDALSKLGQVTIVAPDREMSATSHRITMHQPLRYQQLKPNRYAVEGSPADCVILACLRILKQRPDIVISGVNRGVNLGDDINYSGTVSAAFEAALQGIPAIAVSTYAHAKSDFKSAAQVTEKLSRRVMDNGLPPDVVLNVNFPQKWNGSVRLTRQGRQAMQSVVVESRDPRGEEYFWLHEKIARTNGKLNGGAEHKLMADYSAVAAGYVSVTPLHLDRTAHAHLERFNEWIGGLEWSEGSNSR